MAKRTNLKRTKEKRLKDLRNRYRFVPKIPKNAKDYGTQQLFRVYAKRDTGNVVNDKLYIDNYLRYLGTSFYKKHRFELIVQRRKFTGLDNCECCDKPLNPVVVHHLYYFRLGKEDVKDYRLICEFCHDFLHIEEDQDNYRRFVNFNQLLLQTRGVKFKWLRNLMKPHPYEEVGAIQRKPVNSFLLPP